ncbi:MAG: imidazolonepropionase [Candidatus Thermoplasmatota archaeon]
MSREDNTRVVGKVVDADLLIRKGTVATMEGASGPRDAVGAEELGLEAGWTVAVKAGRISWIGPDDEWKGKATRVIEARRKLVTPGYVDSHTHLVYGGDRTHELKQKLQGRSYMEILEKGGGIMSTVRATRAASDNELEETAAQRLRQMLQCGTTTVEAKSGYGLDTATELRILALHGRVSKKVGVPIVSTFLGAHAVPEEFKDRTDAYVDLIVDEMLPKVAEQHVARFCDAFVETGVFTVEQGQRILTKARELGFQLRVHADELSNSQGAELAATMGCLSADHLLQVSDAGIAALAASGTVATLTPTVPLTLMTKHWAPARKLLDAHVPIAVATDHNPNNPVVDLQFAAQLSSYAMGLTPNQALTAVTWNAACALDVQDKVGSIEVGKVANLLVHDVAMPQDWVACLGRNTAKAVILSGKLVPPLV